MKSLILFFCLLSTPLCFCMSLKERLLNSSPGTFIVTEQNKTYTLLHIHSLDQNEILFEEISVPVSLTPGKNWKTWVNKGAPGHTSWLLYSIDLLENQAVECYSFTQESHLPIEGSASFLTTLLDLNLTPLTDKERFMRGATAKAGEVNYKPWNPPIIQNGKRVEGASCDVCKTTWPKDDSPFSGKRLFLYFDEQDKSFPFPYWIEMSEKGFKFKIRVIDSGKGLTPRRTLSRRAPSFIGGMHREKEKSYFILDAPNYLHDLKLCAIDLSESSPLTLFFPSLMKKEGVHVRLEVEEQELKSRLKTGHQYIWGVFSERYNLYAEMKHTTIFRS